MVCCSVMQCDAVSCSVLQCVAVTMWRRSARWEGLIVDEGGGVMFASGGFECDGDCVCVCMCV